MSEPSETQAAEDLPEADATSAPPAATPKRRRKLRPAAVIILPLVPLLALAVVWLFGDSWLEGRIRQAIHDAGLESRETRIESSILGGRVALLDADLVASHHDESRSIYRSPRTVLDVAVLDSALAGSAIIDELMVSEALIDLRRFADGSIPGPETGEEPDDELPVEDAETPPRDLVELYQRLREWYERARRWMPEDGEPEQPGTGDRPVRPAEDWERAVRYFPRPTPEQPTPGPRTLIRSLELGGQGIILPDSKPEAPGPLDLNAFRLEGQQVTTRLEPGETMALDGSYLTVAAGAGSFTYRAELGSGALTWAWTDVPLATLADPAISGGRLLRYQPSGSGRMALELGWQGEVLNGQVVVDLVDLQLDPGPEAGVEARELARAVDELRKLHARIAPETPFVIRWPLTIGGSPSQPRITDLGVASLQAAITDAGRQLQQAATAKAKAAAQEATGAAIEEGKGLIEDVTSGKDVEGSAKERLKNLESKGEGLKGLLPGKK